MTRHEQLTRLKQLYHLIYPCEAPKLISPIQKESQVYESNRNDEDDDDEKLTMSVQKSRFQR